MFTRSLSEVKYYRLKDTSTKRLLEVIFLTYVIDKIQITIKGLPEVFQM